MIEGQLQGKVAARRHSMFLEQRIQLGLTFRAQLAVLATLTDEMGLALPLPEMEEESLLRCGPLWKIQQSRTFVSM